MSVHGNCWLTLGLAFCLIATRRLPPAARLKLLGVKNIEAILLFNPGQLSFKLSPLIRMADIPRQNHRWRGTVSIGLIKVAGENHK